MQIVTELEDFRENTKETEMIGRDIALYITIGPDVAESYKGWCTEKTISRTLFLAITIDKIKIRMISYNLSRSILTNLHTSLSEEIQWLHQRYLLLNSSLT